MTRAYAALAPAALVIAGCLGPPDFHCQTHDQCGPGGTCEVDGHCSRTDPQCPSGRRYVHEAGALGDACVGNSCPDNAVVALAAGTNHACVLRAAGDVWCWGQNDEGRLGDGTRTPRSLAVPVPGLAAIGIAAGDRHSCAVRTDGAVLCWGADDAGQLGDGGGADSRTPAVVEGVTGAVSVAAGAAFSCAVLNDGTARCWGDDSLGQLGDGGGAATQGALATVTLAGIRSISAHWQHACALRDDETIWCWGANSEGQVGSGSMGLAQTQPVRVQPLTAVTRVATGLAHTCAATRAAGLYCWGSNNTGQLGRDPGVPQPTPTAVPVVTDPVAVAAGAQHTCAVRQGGATLCWGNNADGQLGEGTMTSLPTPDAVTGLVSGTQVTAGASFSCAETRDGAVFCWGDNHYGELGVGSATVRATPVSVALGAGVQVRDLAAGGAHTCAAQGDGRVSCWGANQAGQLGESGDDRSLPAPTRVALASARAVTAGDLHTCARTDDGSLFCWGRGSSGQLGPDHLIDTPFPAMVVAGTGSVTSVAAGDAHTCAALDDGSARCWGANGDGQLGDGTNTGRDAPANVVSGAGAAAPPLGSVVEVAAGAAHSCARLGDGSLRCWGRGDDGQLGDGLATSASVPVTAALAASGTPGAPATAVTAGAAHTCALDGGGRVWCWGRGDQGQLGLGGAAGAATPAPVTVPASGAVTAVAAGGAHTCAVAADGGVWCWGANDDGQLGLGVTDPDAHGTPAPVPGVSGAMAVATGAAHTCAWRDDGAVWCWGGNFSGQLGDGVTLTYSGPLLARLACGQ